MVSRAELEKTVAEYEAVFQELARRRLDKFCQYVMPEYQIIESIHKPIIDLLERIANGEVKKAIINMPPRAGKSQLISQLFPAYILGKYPTKKIVTSSYGEDLAGDMSRGAKALVQSEYFKQVFPNWKFGEKEQGLYWQTDKLGHYYAVGVGGSLTGKGFDIGIIDDPVKDREEAESQTIQKRIWNWYRSVFLTRRQDQNSAIILMQTRWHVDDLAGKIIDQEGDEWEQLIIPAIDDDGNELIRPGKWDKGYMYQLKEELGPYDFASLYQQTPYLDSEGVFKDEYFDYYSSQEFNFKRLKRFTFVDPAISQKQTADRSAIITIGVDTQSNFIYVLDVFADRVDPSELIENIFRINKQYKPERIGIESNHFQASIVMEINRQMRQRNEFFLLDEIKQKMEKHAKIKSMLQPRYARNTILHPENNVADELEKELLAFPMGRHDDTIDALASAIQLVNQKAPQQDNSPSMFTVDFGGYL